MSQRPPALDAAVVLRAVDAALAEDLGTRGDLTTEALFPAAQRARARIVARSDLVLAGVGVAEQVFVRLDPRASFAARRADGEALAEGEEALSVAADVRAILSGERTALNFLMRMSGIASAARLAVEEVAGTRARILDTRKTAPGLRRLDKYAASCGGAINHRLGLDEAVMIKDSHLDAGRSIAEAVRLARAQGHDPGAISVEARSLDELSQALDAGAGRVLLDNMDLATLQRAVRLASGRVVLEASGGLRPGALRPVAESGVDYLSLGWLTHSAPAADLALEMETPE